MENTYSDRTYLDLFFLTLDFIHGFAAIPCLGWLTPDYREF